VKVRGHAEWSASVLPGRRSALLHYCPLNMGTSLRMYSTSAIFEPDLTSPPFGASLLAMLCASGKCLRSTVDPPMTEDESDGAFESRPDVQQDTTVAIPPCHSRALWGVRPAIVAAASRHKLSLSRSRAESILT